MSWLTGWDYRIKITSQNAKVASAYSYAMVYDCSQLSAAGYNNFWTSLKAGGADIRITKSNGTTEVARGVREFDTTNKKGLIYFNADGISTSADTDFYIYYGNSEASDYADDHATLGMEKVFSADYKFYSTMEDLTTSTIKDETSNDNDGSKTAVNAPNEVDGKLGKAQDFDGTDDRVNLSQPASMNLTSNFVLGAVVKSDDFSRADIAIFSKGDTQFAIKYKGGTTARWEAFVHDGGWKITHSNSAPSTGTWYFVLLRHSGTEVSQFINGDKQTNTNTSTGATTNTDDIHIGNNSNAGGVRFWDGIIDDCFLIDDALSDDEIKTISNNLMDNTTFWSTSAEEEAKTTTNSEKDIELTGQSEDNSERNIDISGAIESNSERNIELEGTTNVWWIERQIDGGEWISLQEEIQIDPDGTEYTYTDEYEFVIGTQYCYRVKNAYGYVSSILLSTLQLGSDIKLTWSYE